ncbi:hypothetical protein [Desulfoluna butyratoxydans]|uniref:Uncharacterized protein n=1 Tax=Desulfoluna butyratoxydans TaxID=231438 RepID=A0A4U8YTL2_9BACT|nr:hypothetical protein [Desulfoluna butyratoxydans]VFQ45202.1 hypothetical protein MSL71_28590 [Desulfoluna butyratoxydans]
MTDPTSKVPMDKTPPDALDDHWLEDDDEPIELTELAAVNGDVPTEDDRGMSGDDGSVDAMGPDSEDEDDILELTEEFRLDDNGTPQEDASSGSGEEVPDLGDETIDLTEMAGLVEEPLEGQLPDLGEETIDLTEMAGLVEEPLEGQAPDLGEETIDLTEMAGLVEEPRDGQVPDLGDETIDLTEMAALVEETPEEQPPDLGEETLDLTEMAGLTEDVQVKASPESEEDVIDLTDMASLVDGVTEEVAPERGDEVIDLTEISSLLEEDPASQGEEVTEFGGESLDLSFSLDDLDTSQRSDVLEADTTLDVAKGDDDGFVDIDLLLADSEDGDGGMDSMAGEGLLGELSEDTVVLPVDDDPFVEKTVVLPVDDEPLLDLGMPLDGEDAVADGAASEEGLLDALSDETVVLNDDEPLLDLGIPLDEEPSAAEEAPAGDGLLDDLPDETVMLADDEDPLLDLGMPLDEEPAAATGDREGGGVLDLSDLVDEQGRRAQESEKPERRPPGFPEGTFDLAGINDDPTVDRGDEQASVSMAGLADIPEEQLERVVERVIRTMFKERIEELIVDAIGKNLSEDIEKMKKMIRENFS